MIDTLAVDSPWLMLGDCLERMREIPDGSVDMILCDLPYGTLASAWDTVIPFDSLWSHYKRLIKPYRVIALTASQPFTSALGMSNPSWLKYSWVWEKSRTGGFWDCKYRPLKAHEDVLIFSQGGCSNGSRNPMPYYPQGLEPPVGNWTAKPVSGNSRTGSTRTGVREASGYPRSVQRFSSDARPVHNTQKPVELMEYLIRTYTNPGEIVMDNCFGSGTTGIACVNTGRRFIGIEQHEPYFNIGQKRIDSAIATASQPAPLGGLFDVQAAE